MSEPLLSLRSLWTLWLFCFMAAPAAGAPADELVGRWYTEGVEHGLYAQMIEERRADGSFILEIRARVACAAAASWRETGSWDYADGTLRKWTRTVSGRTVVDSDHYHDQFTLTPIDGEHTEALDAKTRIAWPLLRVPRNFTFPTPPSCVTS